MGQRHGRNEEESITDLISEIDVLDRKEKNGIVNFLEREEMSFESWFSQETTNESYLLETKIKRKVAQT